MERSRIPTFVAGLDERLGGGIPEGYVVLVAGAPGTMKSSFCYGVAYRNALERGVKAAYVTLEQGKDLLLEHMASLGMADPRGLGNVAVLDLGAIRKHLAHLQAKGTWLELFKMHASNFVRSEGVSLLVLDSLDALEVLGKFEDRRWDFHLLFEWLRDLGITSLLVSELPANGAAGAPQRDELYLADGVVHLGLHPTSEVYVQRRLRCVKMRSTKHETGYFALVWEDGRFEVTRAVSGIG